MKPIHKVALALFICLSAFLAFSQTSPISSLRRYLTATTQSDDVFMLSRTNYPSAGSNYTHGILYSSLLSELNIDLGVTAQSNAFAARFITTSNDLGGRITTTSNGLQTGLDGKTNRYPLAGTNVQITSYESNGIMFDVYSVTGAVGGGGGSVTGSFTLNAGYGMTIATNGTTNTASVNTNDIATRAWASAQYTIVSNGAVASASAEILSSSNVLATRITTASNGLQAGIDGKTNRFPLAGSGISIATATTNGIEFDVYTATGGGGTNPTNLPGTGILITTNNANSHTFTADTNTLATRAWATAADTVVSNGAVATASAEILSASNVLATATAANTTLITTTSNAIPSAITTNSWGHVDYSYNLESLYAFRNKLRNSSGTQSHTKILVIGDSYSEPSLYHPARLLTLLAQTKATSAVYYANWENQFINTLDSGTTVDTSGTRIPANLYLCAGTNGVIWGSGNGFESLWAGLAWIAHPGGSNITFQRSFNGGAFSTMATLDGYSPTNVLRTTNINTGFVAPMRLRVVNTAGSTNWIVGPTLENTFFPGIGAGFIQLNGAAMSNWNTFQRQYLEQLFTNINPDLILVAALDETNDVSAGLSPTSNLGTVLNWYSNRVCVLGVPPYMNTATNPQAFNRMLELRANAVSNGWSFVDLGYHLPNGEAQRLGLFTDGDVHPTTKGRDYFATATLDAIVGEMDREAGTITPGNISIRNPVITTNGGVTNLNIVMKNASLSTVPTRRIPLEAEGVFLTISNSVVLSNAIQALLDLKLNTSGGNADAVFAIHNLGFNSGDSTIELGGGSIFSMTASGGLHFSGDMMSVYSGIFPNGNGFYVGNELASHLIYTGEDFIFTNTAPRSTTAATDANHLMRLGEFNNSKRETWMLYGSGPTNSATVGTNLVMIVPFNCTIETNNAILAFNRHIGPTGSQARVELLTNGVSIMTTPFHVDAGELTSLTALTNFAFSTTNLIRGSFLEFKTLQVGATVPGSGIHVALPIKETP